LQENKDFYEAVDKIFHIYSNQIKNGQIEQLSNNKTLLMIIDTYCMINGIENEEEQEQEELPLSTHDYSDSLKIYLNEIQN
jgi:hypothetical protein